MFDTWTCHVCGKKRPDAKISVYTTTRYMGRVPFTENVRYCNDDPACINGVANVKFVQSATDQPIGEGRE